MMNKIKKKSWVKPIIIQISSSNTNGGESQVLNESTAGVGNS